MKSYNAFGSQTKYGPVWNWRDWRKGI